MTRPGSRPGPDELRILVFDAHDAARIVAALRERGCPGEIVAAADEPAARAAIGDAHVLVSGPFPVRVLAAARELRWIQSLWAGVDSWRGAPIPAGVRLTRMTGIFAAAMAEYVFAHLLARTQRLAEFDDAQRDRAWRPRLTTPIAGQRLGVAGWGEVGRQVGAVGGAFGMRVRALRRTERGTADPAVAMYPSSRLPEFLTALDVLVLALPETAESRGLIGAAELERLADGAVVVNIGRGGVLDEAAVVRALAAGTLAHAVLDAFRTEPLPASSPLWSTPDLTVTPHVSGPTRVEEAAEVVVANVARFLAGEWPEPVVDLGRGY